MDMDVKVCLMAASILLGVSCVAAETNDCIVISGGQKFVFGDSGVVNDALWGFIRVTGGDVVDMNPKHDCVYKFKKRLGPFTSAKFTTYKKGEKRPLFGESLKSVSANMIVQGQSFADGIAQLNDVRAILEREIKSAAFTTTVQTEHLYELSTVHSLPGGWEIMLRVGLLDGGVVLTLTLVRDLDVQKPATMGGLPGTGCGASISNRIFGCAVEAAL